MRNLLVAVTAILTTGAMALSASAATIMTHKSMMPQKQHQSEQMHEHSMVHKVSGNVPVNSFGRNEAGISQQAGNRPLRDQASTLPRDPLAALVPGSGADF